MSINELRQRRAQEIATARTINDKARAEGRDLTAEEQEQFDRAWAAGENLRSQIEREERLMLAEAELREPTSEASRPEPQAQAEGRAVEPRATPEYRKAFEAFLRGGFNGLMPADYRALQSDINTLGGYLVTPQQFVNDLIQAVDNMVYIRQWATTYRVPTAQSLGAPSLDTDPAVPVWRSELATGSEDSSMAFGKRELTPHPLAKRIKVSNKLLRQAPSVEGLVRDRFAYQFAITQENAFLTGSGASSPLGVFTASADGVTTARDVSTDNTTTAITFDNLINVKFTLKGQYWPRARWIFHRDAVKMIAKLVDGEGQYIWRENVRAGEPDTILGMPVFMSEYAPNTFTTGLYVGILGDFSFYWIADALDMQMQRLVELYAESNQVGLIGRMETDGMPVLAEAFVRVKLA